MRFLKTSFLFLFLILLNGCLQSTALLGPGVTVIATGNIPQAAFQYGANISIKNETGKDALTHLKDVVEDGQNKKKFHNDFKTMVKKRIEIARRKIDIN
jgi:hypothetical protein